MLPHHRLPCQHNLSDWDVKNLKSSYIDEEVIQREGIFRVNSLEGKELVAASGNRNFAGIVFNAYFPGESKPREVRLRRDCPDVEGDKTKAKYLSPPGRQNILWFASRSTQADLHNPTLPIVLVEGPKKLLSVDRLSYYDRKEPRFLVIGLAGVWCWRGVIGKTTDAGGFRISEKGVISDMDRVTWTNRKVIILFDSNAATNPTVRAARRELAIELSKRDAKVFSADIPEEEGINGPDDFIGRHGPQAGLELINGAAEFEPNFHLTELGNAERFIHQHGRNVMFVPGHGWYNWEGTRWVYDDSGATLKLMQETSRSIYLEVFNIPDNKVGNRKPITSWALQSENLKTPRNALVLASPHVVVRSEELDTDKMLFNVRNGTINLSTGRLQEHQRKDRITKISPIIYDPSAKCPTWVAFLNKIMAGNTCLIDFLQKAVGYSLTGSTEEQVFFILHGGGQNGKSVFLEAMHSILGQYAVSARSETMMQKKTDSNGPNNDVAALCGMRLVTCSEIEGNRKLKETLIKDLTGGDTITARFLNKEFFNFKPQFKIWMRANYLPVIVGTDEGIWRRIRKIPFKIKIRDEEKDTKLFEKLMNEAPGILNWCITGSIRWFKEGLGFPEELRKETEEYRNVSDVVGRFLTERCEFGDGWRIKASEAYNEYSKWCAENGERIEQLKRFGQSISERGHSKITTKTGVFYCGMRVKGE